MPQKGQKADLRECFTTNEFVIKTNDFFLST